MLRARLFFILVFSVLLVSGSVALWAAMKDDDGEEKVPLSDVPAKVLEAANEAVSGGKITEVEKDVEDDVLIYDVVKVVDGVEYEMEVTASGVVLEVEKEGDEEDDDDGDSEGDDDDEEEVALSEIPDAVIKVARAAIPEGKIIEVDQEIEDGETIYEVEMIVKYEVRITAKGVLLEIEKETDDDGEEDNEEGCAGCGGECEHHGEDSEHESDDDDDD